MPIRVTGNILKDTKKKKEKRKREKGHVLNWGSVDAVQWWMKGEEERGWVITTLLRLTFFLRNLLSQALSNFIDNHCMITFFIYVFNEYITRFARLLNREKRVINNNGKNDNYFSLMIPLASQLNKQGERREHHHKELMKSLLSMMGSSSRMARLKRIRRANLTCCSTPSVSLECQEKKEKQ